MAVTFVEVSLQVWMAAPEALVRQHHADLWHRIEHRVHPQLTLHVLAEGWLRARYLRETKLFGLRRSNLVVREFESDGTLLDTAIQGPGRGTTWSYRFTTSSVGVQPGTVVESMVRMPLQRSLAWLKPFYRAALKRELALAAAQSKRDIERGYYQPTPRRSEAA